MKRLKILLVTPLLIGIFTLSSHAHCKSFKVEAKVTDTVGGGSNGSVELDIPDMSRIKGLSINLFGPKKKNRLGLSDPIISGLEKGKYLVVVSSNEEGNNFCPVSINVTIN
jgi:hypothetical protein